MLFLTADWIEVVKFLIAGSMSQVFFRRRFIMCFCYSRTFKYLNQFMKSLAPGLVEVIEV